MKRKVFLYFIVETATGKSYYVDASGNIQLSAEPKFLPQSPEGWLNNKVTFGRSARYHGLNRTFTVPLKFVGDGAAILRNLFWKTRGINCDLTLIILKWNDETDVYGMYYKGKIDLQKMDDKVAEGVTANCIQGGVIQKLRAYENTIYEIPMDGTIPENIRVNISGYLFDCNYDFAVTETPIQVENFQEFTMPFAIIKNDGITFGATIQSQTLEDINNPATYWQESENYFAKAHDAPLTVPLEGKIRFKCNKNDNGNGYVIVYIKTSLNTSYIIQNTLPLSVGQTYEIPVSLSVPLNVGEKAFLNCVLASLPFDNTEIEFLPGSEINIKTKTKNRDTSTWAITARNLFKLLVQNIGENLFESQSALLDLLPNIVLTCGFSLRQDPNAVLKTNIGDFFDSMNVVTFGSLGNVGEDDKLFFENRGYVFNSDEITMELGEVSNLSISVAEEYLFNLLKIGYEPQTYDEKLGQVEFNTTSIFKSPIDVIAQKELNLVSPYRGDSVGVEFVRSNPFVVKSTTNNDSDNSVFILNIDTENPVNNQFYSGNRVTQKDGYTGDIDIDFEDTDGIGFDTPDNTIFTYNRPFPANVKITGAAIFLDDLSGDKKFQILKNGNVIFEITVPADGVTNAGSPIINEVLNTGDVLQFHVIELGAAPEYSVKSALFLITFPDISSYNLKRVVYDNIEGIPNPETAYNIEELTPKRLFYKHESWFVGVHHNLLDKMFVFQSTDKNPNLSTTLNGVTIKENADEPIGQMGQPLIYPYIFKFDTKVPFNFIDLLTNSANGHIKFLYNGKTLYGFPLEVSAMPALNESQEWKLLVSPKTNLLDLIDLDEDGMIYFEIGMLQSFVPFLCPAQFVPLGLVLPPQYHFKDMDGYWFKEQITFWANQRNYFQPWQKNEPIKIQHQTNGLGPSKVEVLKCDGTVVMTVDLDVIATDAVKAPNVLYQGSVNPETLEEDVYYLLLTSGTGDTITQFISEGIHIKENWDMTLRFDYSNSRNKQSVVFSEGYTPSFRVHGWIDTYTPESKFAVYEDEPADIELLNGIPYEVFKLNIAIEDGIPDWVIKKLNRIMLLDEVTIDGVGYTRNGNSKWEVTSIPGNPKKYWTLEIRKSKNRDGITINTEGQLDMALTVEYNINTKGFGDGAGSDNIVQVTAID